ncbi:auxin-responsive protein SAUR72-like [Mangifera indica]|uniref:auxin-responsive protein SAUR72-like n=1 Tax=Mangifera indica TaxID=29780 RepID=UPI001CFB4330|nr:auxin-responsive protein SAUR72-like [Mangifera indica]
MHLPTPLNLPLHSSVEIPAEHSTEKMDSSKKSNKISDIVRLQQILKKWKKLANAHKNTNKNPAISSITPTSSNTGNKSIKFLKKTLSFSDILTAGASNDFVPKGFLAVCVGKELKRFIIPTKYLSHQAFGILLREAEEEFGFQQEGVLKIPCEVCVFEKILKVVEEKRDEFYLHESGLRPEKDLIGCCSSDCELTPPFKWVDEIVIK